MAYLRAWGRLYVAELHSILLILLHAVTCYRDVFVALSIRTC